MMAFLDEADDGADSSTWRTRLAAQDAALEQLLGGSGGHDGEEVGGGGSALGLDRPADPSVLDEALSISDISEPETPAHAPKSKLRAKRAKQPDWRRKYREEIARLRVEAATLAETLTGLRAVVCNRVVDAEDDNSADPARRQLVGPPSAAALWKRIAKRQQACRATAEQENMRLRALVEQRRKETRELRRAMLFKRANLQGIRDLLGVGWLSRAKGEHGVGDLSDDALVFHSLRCELDALYTELDAIFERNRVGEMRCPDRAIQTKVSESGQIVWEFVDVHAVPFDCDAAARALWLTFGERSWQRQRGSDTQYVQASASECMTRVRFRMSMPVLSISVLTRKVTKKFVERDRAVFVSNSLHQPFFNGKLSSRAAVFREVDRTVVYDAGSGDAHRSEIRRHIIATTGGESMAQVATEGPDWKATDRYSAGVHAWVWAITRDHQAIEDALLREVSQQR